MRLQITNCCHCNRKPGKLSTRRGGMRQRPNSIVLLEENSGRKKGTGRRSKRLLLPLLCRGATEENHDPILSERNLYGRPYAVTNSGGRALRDAEALVGPDPFPRPPLYVQYVG